MGLSVVIPYYEIDYGKQKVLEDTVASMSGYDELIISSNQAEGYAIPINRGIRLAKGDFVMVSNDDMIYDGGDLKRLCNKEAVTSPMVNGRSQSFWGCSFCIPRWVIDKIGQPFMFEGYKISYYDDDDLRNTLIKAGIPMRCIEEVKVSTIGGRTLHQFPDYREFGEENRRLYESRWNNGTI